MTNEQNRLFIDDLLLWLDDATEQSVRLFCETIDFHKLRVPEIIAILCHVRITYPNSQIHKNFYSRAKKHFQVVRPTKWERLLKGLEPKK